MTGQQSSPAAGRPSGGLARALGRATRRPVRVRMPGDGGARVGSGADLSWGDLAESHVAMSMAGAADPVGTQAFPGAAGPDGEPSTRDEHAGRSVGGARGASRVVGAFDATDPSRGPLDAVSPAVHAAGTRMRVRGIASAPVSASGPTRAVGRPGEAEPDEGTQDEAILDEATLAQGSVRSAESATHAKPGPNEAVEALALVPDPTASLATRRSTAVDRPTTASPEAPPVVIGRIDIHVTAPEPEPDPFAGLRAVAGGITARRGGGW